MIPLMFYIRNTTNNDINIILPHSVNEFNLLHFKGDAPILLQIPLILKAKWLSTK